MCHPGKAFKTSSEDIYGFYYDLTNHIHALKKASLKVKIFASLASVKALRPAAPHTGMQTHTPYHVGGDHTGRLHFSFYWAVNAFTPGDNGSLMGNGNFYLHLAVIGQHPPSSPAIAVLANPSKINLSEIQSLIRYYKNFQ